MEELTEEFELDEDTQEGKFLTFTLGSEDYGLEIKYVTEIIGIQEITEVPEQPEYIRGIINLRGKIIPVMDIRLKFKKKFRIYDHRTCIVVVDMVEAEVGIIVDSVSEVIEIQSQNIVDPPESTMGVGNRYISGIGKVGDSIKFLLDCNKLLSETEMEHL